MNKSQLDMKRKFQHRRLPLLEYDPVAHGTQLEMSLALIVVEYVPTGHDTHVELRIDRVAWEYVPAGHAVQVLILLAPAAVE